MQSYKYGPVRRLLAIIIIAALGCLVVWLRPPKPICRVPSTKTVAGCRVTIARVERLNDGQVMVTLLVRPVAGWRLGQIGATGIRNGRGVKAFWAKTDADGTVHAQVAFRPVDEKAGTFSIQQKLPYFRSPKPAAWRFKNIDPKLMPVRVRQSGMDIVLRRVAVNSPVDSNRAHGPGGYRWICRFFDSGVKRKGKLFYSLEIEVPMPDGASGQWDCVLSDGNGRLSGNPDVYFDRFFDGVQQRRAMGGDSGPNMTERTAAKVAPEAGERLYEKRFGNAVRSHKREIELFAFPEMSPPPKRIDVELTGFIPVPGEQSVTVHFDRVPLPR